MKQKQFRNLTLGVFLAAVLIAFTGCEPTKSVDTKEEPLSLPGVVTKIVEMRNKIRDGFATDNLDMAHDPLHKVGQQLEKLELLAEIEQLPADKKKAISKAKEELFDAFGEIDKTFHGKEGKTYDEVADVVDKAMKVLTDIAGVKDDSAVSSEAGSGATDGLPEGDGDAVVEEVTQGEGSGSAEGEGSGGEKD